MKGLILNAGDYDYEPHIFENVTFPFEVEIAEKTESLWSVKGSELIKAGAATKDGDTDGFISDELYPFWRGYEIKAVDF